MKPLLILLVLAALVPSSALAAIGDPRSGDRDVILRPPGVAVTVPSHLPAMGTDVAAPDQQAPKLHPTHASVPAAPTSARGGFEWGAAAIGAAVMLSVLSLVLILGVATGRRRDPLEGGRLR